MQYDFTTILERHGHDAVAVDDLPVPGAEVRDGFSRLPMWVADMSFPTAPAIIEAISRRLQHPCFGYFDMTDEYFDSIIRWQSRRNGVQGLEKQHISYENGVLGGVCSAVMALTSPGEPVLLHSPVYSGFKVIEGIGRRMMYSPLKKDENGIWRMDFEDMDRMLKQQHIHLAVFCSPHNPCGRVWERWEIEKAMEVYRANDCFVVSDEIWSDMILPGYHHIPTQSVSEDARNRTIAMYAPTKTFSLAGLVGSYHIAYNPMLQDRVTRAGKNSHYNHCNVLSMHALIGGYSPEGEACLDQLLPVLDRNVGLVTDYLRTLDPAAELMRPQGTYMLFPDMSKWCAAHGTDIDRLLQRGQEYGVLWQPGDCFEIDNCIRINVALPTSMVEEAIDRLKRYVFC